jgi:hypothetical protein
MNRRLDRPTCAEAFRRLDDYLDRRVTPDDMRLIAAHLRMCDACGREFTFEASVVKGVRERLRRVSAPAGARGADFGANRPHRRRRVDDRSTIPAPRPVTLAALCDHATAFSRGPERAIPLGPNRRETPPAPDWFHQRGWTPGPAAVY